MAVCYLCHINARPFGTTPLHNARKHHFISNIVISYSPSLLSLVHALYHNFNTSLFRIRSYFEGINSIFELEAVRH